MPAATPPAPGVPEVTRELLMLLTRDGSPLHETSLALSGLLCLATVSGPATARALFAALGRVAISAGEMASAYGEANLAVSVTASPRMVLIMAVDPATAPSPAEHKALVEAELSKLGDAAPEIIQGGVQ